MKYLKEFQNKLKNEPFVLGLGLCIFMLAVMGTSVRHVSSTVFALLFLLSLTAIKDWFDLYAKLSRLEKLFLSALVIYTISGALSFYNVIDVDEYIKLFERYFRYLLVVPIYILIIKYNRSLLNYLLTGAVISGPFLAAIAVQHYYVNPNVPAQGYYHHIIFGQLAMLNVGIMLSMLLSKTFSRKLQYLIVFSIFCGLITAALSQARGVWLVFPIYLTIAAYYLLKERRLSANKIIVFLVLIILMTAFTPIGSLIKQRSDTAVTEVMRFYQEQQYVSSLGTRLAMWEIAVDVWAKTPALGTGPGDFDNEIMNLQEQGQYEGMPVHNSVHNIYLQALVGSGLVGLLSLLFVFLVMPLKIFFDENCYNKQGRLAGFITVISFAAFGISESWTLRLSITSVFLVYITVIVSHVQIMCRNRHYK